MKIGYRNSRIEKYCTEKKYASKHLPSSIQPELLFQRLNEIAAFSNLGQIPFQSPPLHFHPLRENHAGRFAVTVRGKYRIVFEPVGAFKCHEDKTAVIDTVTEISIYGAGDYHS